jgi:hypothetical protein
MKQIIFLCNILTIFCLNIYYAYSQDSTFQYIIYSPLSNENEAEVFPKPENSGTWDSIMVKRSIQSWINSGGVFFKTDNDKFVEKSIDIPSNKINCIYILHIDTGDIDRIYIGTDVGIYISNDYGNTWLTADNDNIDNLATRRIKALTMISGNLYACSDSGVYKSTNNGDNWIHSKAGSTVTSITFQNGMIYIGVLDEAYGVYKSSDGINWDNTSLTDYTNCLSSNNVNLYAGTVGGLYKSADSGQTWVRIYSIDKVLSINIIGSDIYLGTLEKGCYLSENNGSFIQINSGLPFSEETDYYSLNSILLFNNKLYIATDNGIYRSFIDSILWHEDKVKDSVINPLNLCERSTKMLFVYNQNDDFWVACSVDVNNDYPQAVVLDTLDSPFNPENYGNYYCHTYAWHLTEGGTRYVGVNPPISAGYIPKNSDTTQWKKENYDYIETDSNDTFWEKVTYSTSHSAVRSPIYEQSPGPAVLDSIIVRSKWTISGPLVEHRIKENPWGNLEIKFWTSRKKIKDSIKVNQEIGRQLITEGTTTITTLDTIQFRVAPMIGHVIHLKDGFHAPAGSTFHAFVDDSRQIPWEVKSKSIIKDSINDSNSLIRMAYENSNQKSNLQLFDTIPCKIKDPIYQYSGKGSGTKEDPYQITNINEFQEIRNDRHGEHYWILMNDLDASETRYWNPMIFGNDTVYVGFDRIFGKDVNTIDGRGHVIRNLYTSCGSVFEEINCMKLKRIGFENIFMELGGSSILFINPYKDDLDVELEECFITGSMKGSKTDNPWIIGFGSFKNNIKVKNCYTDINIVDAMKSYQFGRVNNEASITNSYTTGTSSAETVLSPFGYNGNVVSCFWDADKIIVTNDSLGLGLGLTTAEMMKRSTFESAGWDFENVWYIEEGMDYPKLKCFRDGVGVEEKEPVKSCIAEMSLTGHSDKIKIEYTLPTPGQVKIKIFNSLGALEGVIFEGFSQFSDSGSSQFDASALPSGMYFITLESAGIRLCRQYALIK